MTDNSKNEELQERNSEHAETVNSKPTNNLSRWYLKCIEVLIGIIVIAILGFGVYSRYAVDENELAKSAVSAVTKIVSSIPGAPVCVSVENIKKVSKGVYTATAMMSDKSSLKIDIDVFDDNKQCSIIINDPGLFCYTAATFVTETFRQLQRTEKCVRVSDFKLLGRPNEAGIRVSDFKSLEDKRFSGVAIMDNGKSYKIAGDADKKVIYIDDPAFLCILGIPNINANFSAIGRREKCKEIASLKQIDNDTYSAVAIMDNNSSYAIKLKYRDAHSLNAYLIIDDPAFLALSVPQIITDMCKEGGYDIKCAKVVNIKPTKDGVYAAVAVMNNDSLYDISIEWLGDRIYVKVISEH